MNEATPRYIEPKSATSFFDGVDAKAPAQKLREIAPGYPVFRIETAGAAEPAGAA